MWKPSCAGWAGLKNFLLKVRAKKTKAEILYTYGLVSNQFSTDMQEVINQLRTQGDEHIYYVQLESCSSSERAIGHPTAEAYISRGETIIDAIAKATGWTPYDKSELNKPQEPEETTLAVSGIALTKKKKRK